MILINESLYTVHDTLNPKIWDSNNKLLPDVRSKLMEIVEEFKEYVSNDIEMNIIDAHIVGSNASYNYTEYSDLDVHIVVNFEMIGDCSEILQSYYDAERSSFNDKYDISIHGVNVEIYVEDVKSNTISNGIYSVYKDEWIKYPEKLDKIPDIDLDPELSETIANVREVLNSNDLDVVKDLINELYLMRKNSLATDGEYGKGNQIFKEIRNQGLLDELKDEMYRLTSQELSLESKSIVNEMNTRQIDRNITGLIGYSGYRINNLYNSMKTTKGTMASRQLTVHVDISDKYGNSMSMKFDPRPITATSRTGSDFIPYDPKVHEGEKLYVRAKKPESVGQYDPIYRVYIETTNGHIFAGEVRNGNDLSKILNSINKQR